MAPVLGTVSEKSSERKEEGGRRKPRSGRKIGRTKKGFDETEGVLAITRGGTLLCKSRRIRGDAGGRAIRPEDAEAPPHCQDRSKRLLLREDLRCDQKKRECVVRPSGSALKAIRSYAARKEFTSSSGNFLWALGLTA